jgi:2Fe-2S ferredoxin
MPTIKFIEFDGTEREISAENGESLMDSAVSNNVPGIDADCGGACACATCHVKIDSAWMEKVGPPNELEQDMLEMVDGYSEASRLACQIKIDDNLDGLVVNTPESQF